MPSPPPPRHWKDVPHLNPLRLGEVPILVVQVGIEPLSILLKQFPVLLQLEAVFPGSPFATTGQKFPRRVSKVGQECDNGTQWHQVDFALRAVASNTIH